MTYQHVIFSDPILSHLLYNQTSRNSSLSIVDNRVWALAVALALGHTHLPIQWVPGALFPG